MFPSVAPQLGDLQVSDRVIDCFTFDIEVREEVVNWNATDQMQISVAASHDSKTNRFRVYGDREELREAVLAAEQVAGFNIWSFDLPLLFGVPRSVWIKEHASIAPGLAQRVVDVHRLARLAHGRSLAGPCGSGLNLESVAMATLGIGKTGNGADAPGMWQRGEIVKLTDYCLQDVYVEAWLSRVALEYGVFRTGQGVARLLPDPLWSLPVVAPMVSQ